MESRFLPEHKNTRFYACRIGCQPFTFVLKIIAERQELEAKDKEISRLNTILEKAFKWFPMLREMLRMEKLCAAIGFTKEMIESLLTKKEAIRCNGRIYSEEHRRKFDIKNDVFKVEKNPTDDNKLMLTINRQPIGEWFKEQFNKLRQNIRCPIQPQRKSRGMKL